MEFLEEDVDEEHSLLYYKFKENLKEQEGISIEELLEDWIYAGGFSKSIQTAFHKVMDDALRKKWKLVMEGTEFVEAIPDEDVRDNCICETEIVYNIILVNNKLLKNGILKYIIIGTKCCRNFLYGCKVTIACANRNCYNRHRNRKTKYCNNCRTDKKRCCFICNREMTIGKKRINGLYCSLYCKDNDIDKRYYLKKDAKKDILEVINKLKIEHKILKPTKEDFSTISFHYKDEYRIMKYFDENLYSLEVKNYYDYINKKKIKNNKASLGKLYDYNFIN